MCSALWGFRDNRSFWRIGIEELANWRREGLLSEESLGKKPGKALIGGGVDIKRYRGTVKLG
jgi:hypothetical protein